MNRLIALALLAAAASSCAVITVPLGLPSREIEMREFVLQPAKGYFVTNRILLLDISGAISGEPSSGLFTETPSTLAEIRDALDKAEKDDHIKAVILRINSPGGEVTASDAIYEQIRRFKQKRARAKQPVVVIASMLSEAASGGYYIALAADKIYAHPTTITGSIGVAAVFPKLASLTRMIGVDVRVIKSADKKDIGSMWRDFTAEEQKILQQTIDEMFERFVQVVAENRPGLNSESVRRLADGRIYTAKQALENHLIDGLLYLDDVIEQAKAQSQITDASVITYRRASTFRGGIYSRAVPTTPQASPQINLLQVNAEGLFGPWRQPGFYYLWMP